MGAAGTDQQLALRFGILGPLQVERDGVPVPLGGVRRRVVLAMLLLNFGHVVSVERLIDGVWGEHPPAGALNTLQVHVSQLRRAFGGADGPIVTQPPGYRIVLQPEQLDLLRLEHLTQQADELARTGSPGEAADLLGQAQGLWRGPACEDLGSAPFADTARTFLEERRLGVVDDRLELLLKLGEHRHVVEAAEAVLAVHPLRESLWEKLLVALYRSGRQADALSAYRRCRDLLLEELGVEPMPSLRALEVQILNHDDRLVAPRRLDRSGTVVTMVSQLESGTGTVLRPKRMDARLELPDGSAVPVGSRLVLGRHASCDVVLPDPAVSRRHAEIRLANGRHVLLDLSSSNGTWVTGKPVLQHLLADGDTVQLGDHTLTYRAI